MPSPTFLRGSVANTKEEDVDNILREMQALETNAELLESKLEAEEAEEAAEDKDLYQDNTDARAWYAEADDEDMLDQEEGEEEEAHTEEEEHFGQKVHGEQDKELAQASSSISSTRPLAGWPAQASGSSSSRWPKKSAKQRRNQANRAEAEGRKAKGTWAEKHSEMRLRRNGRALWSMLREFNAEDAEEAVDDLKCPEWCAKREAKAKPALVPRPPSTPPPPWKLRGPPRARVPPPPPAPPRRADNNEGATTGPSLEPPAKPWPVVPPWRRAVGSE